MTFSSRHPWSLFILFFIVVVVIATSLVFVLGRLINITTAVKVRRSVFLFCFRFQKLTHVVNQRQGEAYKEIAIGGDSSDNDISHATELVKLFDVCDRLLSLLFSRIRFIIHP